MGEPAAAASGTARSAGSAPSGISGWVELRGVDGLSDDETHRGRWWVSPGSSPGSTHPTAYHLPVFGIEVHGSLGGSGAPFCNSSIEWRSGERTNAMVPSRGGRLIMIPAFISFSQVA